MTTTSTTPLVSIVVPAFNCERYLGDCLESLRRQTLENIQIIILNDGSADRTRDIAQKYLDDKRFEYFENIQNAGTFHTRLRGFRASRGEYIGTVDADDWVDSNFVEKLLATARMAGSDIAQCRLKTIHPDGTEGKIEWADAGMHRFDGQKVLEGALKRDFWHIACNKLFKRSLFLQAEWFFSTIDRSVVVADDKLLMIPIYHYANNLRSRNERLYSYRQRDESATNNRTLDHDMRHIDDTHYVDKKIGQFLNETGAKQSLLDIAKSNRNDEIKLAIFNASFYPSRSRERTTLFQKIVGTYGPEVLEAYGRVNSMRNSPASKSWRRSKAYHLTEIYDHATLTELSIRRFIKTFHPHIFTLYDIPRRTAVAFVRMTRRVAEGRVNDR